LTTVDVTVKSATVDDGLVELPQPGTANAPTTAITMISDAYRFRVMIQTS
jgi:hypothetical protein